MAADQSTKSQLLRHPTLRWLALITVLLLLIIGPFLLFEEEINEAVISIVSRDQHKGFIFLSVMAALFADPLLPIPSSIVSTFAGELLGLWRGFLANWLGMNTGCWFIYWVAAKPGQRLTTKVVGESSMTRARRLSERYGTAAIAACRAVPVLAEATVISASVTGVPLSRFLLVTALANAGVAMVYTTVGVFSMTINTFLFAFLAATLLPLTVLSLTHRLLSGIRN